MSRLARGLAGALVVAATLFAIAPPAHADEAGTAGQPTYPVKPGDFLKGIAGKLGVPVGDLLAANGLKMNSVIHPGDTLVVPPGGKLPEALPAPGPAPAQAPTTPYVVESGDYLFGIAADHGVTTAALLAANDLKVTSTIQPGQTLAIPPRTLPLAVVTAPAPAAVVMPAQTPLQIVLAYLQAQLGKPYRFNTAGPDAFDCSGLVRAAFAQVGLKLAHYSLLQSTYGVAVDWTTEPIVAGDLVFTFSSDSPAVIGHVGIAIDSRRWIQAAGTGDVVRISSLPRSQTIQAVRRVLPG